MQDSLPEFSIGEKIIKDALSAPIRQIISNAGGSPDIILEKIKEGGFKKGFNAKTGELVDLEKEGIIDPVKVTRTALENATSIASILVTTEAIIVDEEKKPSEQ